jgi:hypothetical protein
MMKRLMNKKKYLAVLVPLLATATATATVYAEGLKALDDDQMSAQTGQALLNLSYIAPTDAANIESTRSGGDNNTGFYKLGIEAEMELNANIKNLQLGCGGVNGPGACDIDIKNLSLSGLNDGTVTTGESAGSPTFSDGRPATSAKLTNPFIEFAIKNPDSAAGREMVGFRLSAESIEGLLTAGLENLDSPSTTDGIQTLSGYMQVAGTTGDVNTVASTFGKGTQDCLPRSGGDCQAIGGKIRIPSLFTNRYIRSLPTDSNTTGITVPSLKVDFDLPAFTINGSRQTQAVVEGVSSTIPWLPIAAAGVCPTEYAADCANANAQIEDINFTDDQLYVNITKNNDTTTWPEDCVLGFVCYAKFKMVDGSAITDLKVDITFEQSLSMFHNIPLKGTGGYLSLQKQAVRWPGANSDDVAQRGWWMSFAEPVDLGYLQAQNKVDISAVLPQVADYVTDSLLAGDRISVGFFEAIGVALSTPLTKKLIIDVGNSDPAKLTLQNQQLRSQGVVSNCWGNMTMGC